MRLFVLGSFVHATCVQVARLPAAGESLAATALHQGPGGKGFNVAVAARRLGAEVDVLLATGDDASAGLAAAALEAERVATTHLLRISGERSGHGVGFIGPDGDNCIAVYPGANACLDAGHVAAAAAALARADIVCAQFEIADAPIVEAFRRARAAGVRTLLNPSPWRVPPAGMLADCDVLVVNVTEAAALMCVDAARLSTPQAVSAQLLVADLPLPLVVVTMGSQGCVAREAGAAPVHRPALPVAACDSTGAGDAFTAALAVALARGDTLDTALELASACGGLTCTRLGVLEALPDADEALALLAA